MLLRSSERIVALTFLQYFLQCRNEPILIRVIVAATFPSNNSTDSRERLVPLSGTVVLRKTRISWLIPFQEHREESTDADSHRDVPRCY